jgi:hypothetical protein
LENGKLFCIGENNYGPLGSGTTILPSLPLIVLSNHSTFLNLKIFR